MLKEINRNPTRWISPDDTEPDTLDRLDNRTAEEQQEQDREEAAKV